MRLLLAVLLLRECLSIEMGEVSDSLIVEPDREVLDVVGDFSCHFLCRDLNFQDESGDKPRALRLLILPEREYGFRPRRYWEPFSRWS